MTQEQVIKKMRSGWTLHHNVENNAFELKAEMMSSIFVMPHVGKPTIAYLNDLIQESQIDEKNFVYVIKK